MGIRARRVTRLAIASAVSIGVVSILVLAQIPAAGQTAPPAAKASAAKPWTPPCTSDGHPDLSGFWDDRSATPLERDSALGAKEFYTDAEFAELSIRQRRDGTIRPVRGGGNAPDGEAADGAPAAGGGRGAAARGNVAQAAIYDNTVYGDDRKLDPLASTKRTSFIVGPEGRIPPMLPAAVKRNADRAAALRGHEFDSYEYRNLEERCILSNLALIPSLPNRDVNVYFQIVQGPGSIVIAQEISHETRTIPTDGRPHLPKNIRQLQGDSVGHWEGDTLVVDTTNFTDRTAFRGSSENLHLVERFTRTGPDTILYRFTVDDPATWATPWTAEVPWTTTRNAQGLFEYACQEGNDAVKLVLRGARTQERQAAAKKAVN